MSEKIIVYPWGCAPMKYETLSRHGGDEDWAVYVPKDMRDYNLPGGLEQVVSGDEDSHLAGWGHVDKHELGNGDMIIIFACLTMREVHKCLRLQL